MIAAMQLAVGFWIIVMNVVVNLVVAESPSWWTVIGVGCGVYVFRGGVGRLLR